LNTKSWIFIVNPISGKGKAEKISEFAKKHLQKSGIDYQIIKTTHKGNARELANKFREKVDVIIAVGGDGTVNEIGSELLDCERTALGIIPCGSGNGLARSLSIPLKMGAALKNLLKATEKKIDVGKMNDHVFLCCCGFGFDALIAHKFANAAKRGFSTYAKIVYKEIFKFSPIKIEFTVGDKKYTEKVFMLLVANAPQFGNNIYINPLANLSDGALNLTWISPFPNRRIISILWAMRLKNTHRIREFQQRLNDKFTIHPASELAQIDGEPIIVNGLQNIQILNDALKVLY
jgi:YegS/Rv2252/BmrU family lipid kinase